MNSISESPLRLFLATVGFVLNATLAATFPTTPTLTTVPTTPHGCVYKGNHYPPGALIEKGSSTNRCYGTLCDANGQIERYDDIKQCLLLMSTLTPPTTTTPSTTPPTTTHITPPTTTPLTTTPPTTTPPTTTPPTTTHPTTTPPTTTPPTTTPPTTKHRGCLYNGKHYQPGTTIEHGLCYSIICSSNSEILHGDDFNCLHTTLPPTITPPKTTEPTAGPQQIVG